MSGRPLTPARKSYLGGSKRLSLKQKRGHSNHVIYQSHLNVVENFGSSLPVLVREALTFSEKSSVASVRISNEGWAWFVSGRRLLVWQCYSYEDGQRRPVTSLCRELTLPSSDLAYRAELVTLFFNGNQVPSCMAASPEGIVRYWPSIAHEGSSVEVNADLHGQECDSLTDVSPMGCILATTTASVVLLTTLNVGGRASVTVRPFNPPQGWLGGITKLIPSLIFGSLQTAHGMETKLVKVAATPVRSAWMLYMLAGHTLQQWLLAPRELERLVYECDLSKLAVEAFQKTIWESSNDNPADILIWFLDLQPTDDGVCVLLGATNPQVSMQFFYALGTLIPNSSQQPTRFDRFCPIRSNTVYRESDEHQLLSCRVLFYCGSALLYTRKSLLAVSATNYGEDADTLDLVSPSDEILGACLCRGTPVLFTRELGLVQVKPVGPSNSAANGSVSDMATADSSIMSLNQEPVAVVSDSDLEEMENSSHLTLQLEAAFIYFIRRNNEKAERLLRDILPRDESGGGGLDAAVVRASLNIIDATPSSDPRWAAHKLEHNIGSASLQIANQLEDKLRAVDSFVAFLKWSKLWEKLRNVMDGEIVCDTKLVLAEHSEYVIAAMSIKELHSVHGSLIDQCIQHVVGKKIPTGLTAQDVFYREVSRICFFLQALVSWSETLAHSDRRPQEIALSLSLANTILIKCLDAILERRQQHLPSLIPNDHNVEYIPWTARLGSLGLRQSLTLQHSLSLKYGARVSGEIALRTKLYEQLLRLTDIILEGWRAHVASVRNQPKHDALNQQYETARYSLIKPFLDDCEYERAAVLGEKYLDFNVLVQVCEHTDNLERLDSYCEKYSEQNFSEFLFNWYIKEGKPGRLLERFRQRTKPSQQQQLSQFLGDHPSLSWLQDIFCHDFARACNTLQSLANSEKDLLHRKKTMISLAKLAELAANEPKEIEEERLQELDNELELVAFQEDLPESVLTAHGFNTDTPHVLTPSEIIKLYVSEHNTDATEVDFKKALDLLAYVDSEIHRLELREEIWSCAILKDDWDAVDADAPIDTILNLFFFRLFDLLECIGNYDDLIPPSGTLLESEKLTGFGNELHFQYLMRLGYEHFQKPFSTIA